MEPSFKRVIEELITIWIGYILYNIFWESKLSEWAARVIHLEGSADEVKRQGRAVRLTYFRALHENSDKNIREIFSSTTTELSISRENASASPPSIMLLIVLPPSASAMKVASAIAAIPEVNKVVAAQAVADGTPSDKIVAK